MIRRLPENYSERARGVVLGAAIGDALGWPQEQRSNIVGGDRSRKVRPELHFRSWERNSGNRFARYQETIEAGEYSDDTQLLLAVARSLLHGDRWLQWLSRVELPAWTLYQRGGGRAVISASRRWAEGHEPWTPTKGGRQANDPVVSYFRAGANGVAMRIAPHAVVTANDQTADRLLTNVMQDGITTHGHPRALVGAALHAAAVRNVLLREGTLGYGDLIETLLDDNSWQGLSVLETAIPDIWHRAFREIVHESPQEAWMTTVGETRDLLRIAHESLSRGALANDEQTLESLGCFDKRVNGAGTITAVAAAYVATRAAARPASGLLRAAFLPRADTDTLASMVASILGAIHGVAWCAELALAVQDSKYLGLVADKLAMQATERQPQTPASVTDVAPRISALTPKDLIHFKNAIFDPGASPRLFVDGRPITAVELRELPSALMVLQACLTLDDSQTLVLDHLVRRVRAPQEPGLLDLAELDEKGQSASSTHGVAITEATLAVKSIDRSMTFYRDVFQLRIDRLDAGSARVGSWLVLTQRKQSDSGVTENGRHLLLTIRVPKLEVIRDRAIELDLGEVLGIVEVDGERQLRIRDPDGNDLRVITR